MAVENEGLCPSFSPLYELLTIYVDKNGKNIYNVPKRRG